MVTPAKEGRDVKGSTMGLRLALVGLVWSLALGWCSAALPAQVVIYTSVDQVYSQPILDRFEKETGITVKAVYDVEASKTTGLVNRLIAEKSRP